MPGSIGASEYKLDTTDPSNGPLAGCRAASVWAHELPKPRLGKNEVSVSWEPMTPEGSTIRSHGSPLLQATRQMSPSYPIFKWECNEYPSICTLVKFWLSWKHTQDLRWRVETSSHCVPFLQFSGFRKPVMRSLRKHLCIFLKPTSFSRKPQCLRNSSARSCPEFTLNLFLPGQQQTVGSFHSLLPNSDEGCPLHLHNRN